MRQPRSMVLLCAALWLLVMGGPLNAHTLSESHSTWQIHGNQVRAEMLVPDLEARRLTPSGKDLPTRDAFVGYMARHLQVSSRATPCKLLGEPHWLSATSGFFRAEMLFDCPDARGISIGSTAFFELVPSHTNFARVQTDDGRFFEQLLTTNHREIAVSGEDSQNELQNAGFLKFVQMGVMHIFTGIDHMSFMLGLVLLARRVRDLLFVVTGFTIGHSLTLALAVTGVLRPDGAYIDALVALTIALIGAENLGDASHRPGPFAIGLGGVLLCMVLAKTLGVGVTLPTTMLIGGSIFSASYLMLTGHLSDAARVRLLVTLVFGLIHGFGFASNLLQMQLPVNRLAQLLVGFNLGVEIGQVVVVLSAILIARLIVKIGLGLPRPLFTDIAASFLVGEGLFWFLGRSVALG